MWLFVPLGVPLDLSLAGAAVTQPLASLSQLVLPDLVPPRSS